MNRALRHGRRLDGGRCDVRVLFHSGAAAERPGWHRAPPGVSAWIRADGRQVRIADSDGPRTDAETQVRRVLPYCAALQGRLMLHAAAVAARGGVHAFIGPGGVGKSTLARELATRGFAVVADDLLLCLEADGGFAIPLPGPRRAAALPLTAVYFLERRAGLSAPCCQPLSKGECFGQLLRHGFGELAVADVWALQFRLCRRIADRTSAYRLEVPDDSARLRDGAEMLIRERLRT